MLKTELKYSDIFNYHWELCFRTNSSLKAYCRHCAHAGSYPTSNAWDVIKDILAVQDCPRKFIDVETVIQQLTTQSFSYSGHPHDNAVAESFFATLKQKDLSEGPHICDRF